MPQSVIRMATVSDIHYGHPKTPTAAIVNEFDLAFFNDPQNTQLDILYLAGDVFHQLLTMSCSDVHEIMTWVRKLIRFCSLHDILLRVLEGTPSHDRTQSKLFETILTMVNEPVDYAYVSTISIEYIARLDIHVLYVPDQPSIHPDAVLKTVDELMLARGLEQVDYAIMHGHFKHQLPEVVKHPSHDLASYMRRVKYLVFIGHVHLRSNKERVFAQGSFSRISHGEEGPKGYYRATVHVDGTYEAEFVVNTTATIFKTIDLTGKTLDESLPIIDGLIDHYPENSHIRLRMRHDHPWAAHFGEVQRRCPYYYWKKEIVGEKDPDLVEVLPELEYAPLILNKDTLAGAVKDRIQRKATLSAPAWALVQQYLNN